jgi:hypothetical protein
MCIIHLCACMSVCVVMLAGWVVGGAWCMVITPQAVEEGL